MIFDILPSEMLLEINKHLDVYSRTKFSIALPKPMKIKPKCKVAEKKLGIIVKAIKKKRINNKNLSSNIKQQLAKTPKDDPTFEIIKEHIPSIDIDVDIFRENKPLFKDLIRDDIQKLLQSCSNEQFNELYKKYTQVFDNHTKFIILLYNPKLFEYILKNKREFMDSFDINYYLPNLTCNLESIKLAIEHYDISQEVLMKTYIKSIENFNLETSEFIDTKLI